MELCAVIETANQPVGAAPDWARSCVAGVGAQLISVVAIYTVNGYNT